MSSAHNTKLTGTYEYWERQGHYRIRLDRVFGYPWPDIAFDGKFLQGEIGVDAVEIRRGDDRFTPLPDGPLALALAPLRVNDPTECPLCQLRLADLKQALQLRRDASARLAASESQILAGAFDAGALRMGEADAQDRLIRLAWPPDKEGGSRGIEITLNDYQPIAGTGAVFPMRLSETLTPETSVEYTVERIDLSPAFGDEVFDIHTKARKILYGKVDKDGSWHGHYVRYMPTPGPTKCNSKATEVEKR